MDWGDGHRESHVRSYLTITSRPPYVVTVMRAVAERFDPWTVAVMMTGPAVAVEGARTVPSDPTVARAGSEVDHVTESLWLSSDMVTVATRRMEVT